MNENNTKAAPVAVGDHVQERQNWRHTYVVTVVDAQQLGIRMQDITSGTFSRCSFGSFAAFFKKVSVEGSLENQPTVGELPL